jgi:hypothetical protein
MQPTSTTTARRMMTPPDARYKTRPAAAERKDPFGSEHMTGGQRTGDPAGPQVAFFVAAHVPEHSLMLVPQQSAPKTGVLAPAMASGNPAAVFARPSSGLSAWPGPRDPSPPRRHGEAFPCRRQRHGTGAMAVTAAGPVSGRKPEVRHRPGDRDTP